jgi:CubicO group peptidase (beta-lactamase class C family)
VRDSGAMSVSTADALRRARPIIDSAIGELCTACVLHVERNGVAQSYATGSLQPDGADDRPCTTETFFDLASLTKLATTALLLTFVRDGTLTLDSALADLVAEFPERRVTLRQVITHTAGLAWWRPLYKEATGLEAIVLRAAREPLANVPGSTFTYSDLGYIMLTKGLGRAGGAAFETVMEERLFRPLRLGPQRIRFLPDDRARCAATEQDESWRRRRLRGEVHDENAFAMGGVAGHAGLFGTASAVAALARVFSEGAVIGEALAAESRREHATGANARRGLGLALRAPEGPMCGRYFSSASFGHSGFTGTTLWVDPEQDLSVVLLTNRVYYGRSNDEPMYRFRIAVHEAVSAPA